MAGFYSEMIQNGNSSGECYFDQECLEALQGLGASVESNSGGCHTLTFGEVAVECYCYGEPDYVVHFFVQEISGLPSELQELLKTYEQCPGESGRRPGVTREAVAP